MVEYCGCLMTVFLTLNWSTLCNLYNFFAALIYRHFYKVTLLWMPAITVFFMKTVWRSNNVNSLEARPTLGGVLWEERTSQEQRRLWVVSSTTEHEGEIVQSWGFFLYGSFSFFQEVFLGGVMVKLLTAECCYKNWLIVSKVITLVTWVNFSETPYF